MVLLTTFFAVATWLEEKERQRRLQRYLNLVILVTWLETLRRQMVWEDHLADIWGTSTCGILSSSRGSVKTSKNKTEKRQKTDQKRQKPENRPKTAKGKKSALFRANKHLEKFIISNCRSV